MGVAASEAAEAAMSEHHAQPESRVMGPMVEGPHDARVVFYRLTRKFVDTESDVSERGKDIIYYTLAIGHNTAIIDVFDEVLACTADEYRRIVECVTDEKAHRKLAGLLRFGEILVMPEHVVELSGPLHADAERLATEGGNELAQRFIGTLADLVDVMDRDRAVYYVGRVRE